MPLKNRAPMLLPQARLFKLLPGTFLILSVFALSFTGMRVADVNIGDTQLPTITITAPAAETITGTINVTADASDSIGIEGVQFLLNGENLDAEDIVAPYSVSWNTLTVPNGTYTLTAIARNAAGDTVTSAGVIVTVNNDTQLPTVTITSPAAGTVTGAMNVTASASDDVGVVSVEFLLNGISVGAEDSTTTAYAVSWNTLTATNGSYTLTAIARDAAGNTATSAGVIVTVNNDTELPTVIITAPAAGTVTGTMNVTASASDDVGVVGVQFLLNGISVGAEDTTIPYSVSWNTLTAANGTYTLTAIARDAAGNTGTSAGVIVIVNNDTQLPTISITAPTSGNVSGTTNVTANASDNVGVAAVQFLLNGVNLGTEDIAAPYSVSWNTLTATNSTYTLTAIARDAAGNTATSAGVIITVNNDTQRPTVNITAPAAGNVSGTINVTANASDNLGVAGVQFLLNGVNLGTEDIASPYSVSWNTLTVPNGSYILTAKARDAAGNLSNSSPVTVTVFNVNLVAAFSFNENTGTMTYDNSGNGNHGTLTNGPAWSASGKYGAAISFDGTNDLVNIIDANSLDLTNGMTLEAWIKPSNMTGYKTVLCKENGTSNLAYALSANNNNATVANQHPDTRIRIGSTSTTTTSTGTTKLALNTWTHIASTYDGTTLRFFINGTQVSATAVTGNMVTTTNMLRIGGSTALGGQYFAGLIDEVKIYNRALSQVEIQTDMTIPVWPDNTNPTVTITAPAAGNVSGIINVTANASDNIAVAGVQFLLNGVNLGTEDIASPYSFSWNTLTVPNGTYTLTARARDAAGNLSNSSPVTVTVFNVNLVAAFSFNENTGTMAFDNSGNCNNGTLTNGPAWSASGKYGAAISFDGTNDLVNIIDANSLDLTNGMTLEAWIKPGNLTGYKTVLCKENGTSNLAYALSANDNNATVANQRPNSRILIGSATTTSTGTGKLALDTWAHIASTYDGTTLRFFINGTQVSATAVTGNMVTTANMLRIGGSTALGGQYFAGLIDEVRIYNRALSQAEIQTDMTIPIVPAVSSGVVGALTAVSTFESIGLYWSGTSCYGGGSNVVCNVQYRVAGSNSAWRVGYPLSFDSRLHNANDVSGVAAGYNKAWIYTGVTRPANEYRGSIVGLTAGTNYEIKLSLQGTSATNTITQATWDETNAWHVASTVAVPNGNTGLTITSGGTAGNYIKYQPANGVSDTINVNNSSPNCIFINAPYVIISKLTLMGAAEDGIRLGPNAHDILIDSCDISGWGQVGMGANSQSGVRINGFKDNCYGVTRVVIQRCKIHQSRANSNSWDNGGHPLGPNGINFEEAGGNHVIRYNEIYGDANHYFMDGIGGGDNFTKSGFTRSDMDIYGNRITMVYDDGIEAEGANMNCRIWNNFLDNTFTGISNATNSVGPMYIFRNVTHVSQRSQNGSTPAIIDAEDRGPFNKCGGGGNSTVTGGITYLFHNTILEPTQTGFAYSRGMGGGPVDNGGAVKNVVSRNNIWQTHRPNDGGWPSIAEWQSAATSANSYDYDLYNGSLAITSTGGRGSHLIKGTPLYAGGNPVAPIPISSGPRMEGYYLQPGSPGYDAGILLPNFNDNYKGAAPDIGAYENGDLLIITGARDRVPYDSNLASTMLKSVATLAEADSEKIISNETATKGQRNEYNDKNDLSKNIRAELFPNPATHFTTISLSISKSQQVSIRIFDITGRLVKKLSEAKMEGGVHQLQWNLRDENGRQVNTGIYFVKINSGNSIETKKLSVIHQ